jgi:hypothetical protein
MLNNQTDQGNETEGLENREERLEREGVKRLFIV